MTFEWSNYSLSFLSPFSRSFNLPQNFSTESSKAKSYSKKNKLVLLVFPTDDFTTAKVKI